MDRKRVGVHRRGRKPDLTLRRRIITLLWMLTFGSSMAARRRPACSALADTYTRLGLLGSLLGSCVLDAHDSGSCSIRIPFLQTGALSSSTLGSLATALVPHSRR